MSELGLVTHASVQLLTGEVAHIMSMANPENNVVVVINATCTSKSGLQRILRAVRKQLERQHYPAPDAVFLEEQS